MFLNGKPVDPDQLKTLGLMNYGHFTSMRVDDRRVRGLALHMSRLTRDCRTLFGVDLDHDYVRTLVRQAVEGGVRSVVVRVTVFDPTMDLGHPGSAAHPQVLVTARNAVDKPLAPILLESMHYERELPAVKHVGLFGTMYRRRQVQLKGFDDVVFTNAAGFLSEGATWNIGFIDGEEIIWPDQPCLRGVTMDLLQRVHPASATAVNLSDVGRLSGAFVTNAAIGVRPVRGLDGSRWDQVNPQVTLLSRQYLEIEADLL